MRFYGFVGLTRIVVSIVVVGCVLPFLAAADGAVDPSAALLEKSLEVMREDSEARGALSIVVEGQLGQGLTRLTIYGRGIGIWNGERQFALKSKQVREAIDLLIDAKFTEMPERFAVEGEDEKDERQAPIKLLRVVTVSTGDISKTVLQDDRGPLSKTFESLVENLVALCRKPAAEGISASSLEDGLEKVAKGRLAPETLVINANAPQIRSFESQADQGWLLTLEHAILSLRSQVLDEGVRKTGERALPPREVEKLAAELLEAGAPEIPPNVNTTGYTQLTIRVLDQQVRTMARTYATDPDAAAKDAAKSFAGIRDILHDLYVSGIEGGGGK
jgi:hypothetical protein